MKKLHLALSAVILTASSGVQPSVTCSCRTRKNMTPDSPAYTPNVMMLMPLNVRSENSVSGTIGCSATRSR